MDGGALINPRGPLDPGVYWRRRLVLGATLAALTLVLSVNSCGDDTAPGTSTPVKTAPAAAAPLAVPPSATATASATASATATATVRPTPSGAPTPRKTPTPSADPDAACKDSAIRVHATPDQRSYPAGARPVLTLTVTNAGAGPCTQDLGKEARELRLTSGNARVWSSDDCSRPAEPEPVVLKADETRDFQVTWSRAGSAAGCPADRPAAGRGAYRVIGRIGRVESSPVAFLLN